MTQTLKKRLFQLLQDDLQWNVSDNMDAQRKKEREFPVVQLKLSHSTKDIVKTAFKETIRFKIDIFSSYDGEKEILEMEEALVSNLYKMYDVKGLVYIRESGFRILADKSTGVEMKHGIITLQFNCAGQFEEE